MAISDARRWLIAAIAFWIAFGFGASVMASQPPESRISAVSVNPEGNVCANISPRALGRHSFRLVSLDDLLGLRDFGSNAIEESMAPGFAVSPDATHLAIQVRRADPGSNSYCHAILLYDLRAPTDPPSVINEGGEFIRDSFSLYGLQRFRSGIAVPLTPQWSRDGKWIAFLRRDNSVTRLFVWSSLSGRSSVVSEGADDVAEFKWDAERSELRYSTIGANVHELAKVRQEGLSGYRYDTRFWMLESTEPFEERETPKRHFRVSVSMAGDKDAIVAQPLGTENFDTVHQEKKVAIEMDALPVGGNRTRLHAVIDGHKFRCDFDTCSGVTAAWLLPNSATVVFLRREGFADASTGIYRWNVNGGPPMRLSVTDDAFTGCQFTGRLFCGRESSLHPRDVVEIDLTSGKFHQLADLNPEWAEVTTSAVRRLRWTNRFGLEAIGDLVIPSSAHLDKPYPLVIVQYDTRGFLRGGTGDEYPIQALAAAGFAVLSVSRPVDFATSVARSGRKIRRGPIMAMRTDRASAHDSLMRGIDAADREIAIDRDHIAITGLSDGASAATYALIHSRVFSLALLSTCCDDPQITLTSIGPRYEQMMDRRGYQLDWSDPRSGWDRVSLAMNASRICARIIIQAADREARMALYSIAALKRAGVDVAMFVFPDEHHIKWQPAHRKAIYSRTLDELTRWKVVPSPLCDAGSSLKRTKPRNRRDASAA